MTSKATISITREQHGALLLALDSAINRSARTGTYANALSEVAEVVRSATFPTVTDPDVATRLITDGDPLPYLIPLASLSLSVEPGFGEQVVLFDADGNEVGRETVILPNLDGFAVAVRDAARDVVTDSLPETDDPNAGPGIELREVEIRADQVRLGDTVQTRQGNWRNVVEVEHVNDTDDDGGSYVLVVPDAALTLRYAPSDRLTVRISVPAR